MPKIAAALAVFFTIVTCIGFNIARYPGVWEMAALCEHFSQSDESAESATAPQSAAVAESQATVESGSLSESARDSHRTAARGSTIVEPISVYPADTGEGSSPAWSEGAPVAAVVSEPLQQIESRVPAGDANAHPAKEPMEVLPSIQYASLPIEPAADGESQSQPFVESDLERPLVAVKPRGDLVVRRLPPVGQVEEIDRHDEGRQPPADSIPVYPTTGIE